MEEIKNVRVNTTLNQSNKHIQFKLEQSFEFLNILSLNLTQSDIYRSFNSDYGCLVGRVIANGGVGIPNAKISVFIPLEDGESDLVKSIYPFKKPSDVDSNGKQYNLLPRVSQISPFTNLTEIKNGFGYTPKVPLGSFPTKEEVIINDVLLDIHKKYYKYTTTTNESGDYMIFGLPVGLQSIHLSVDITDIGKYSMTPSLMIKKLGYSEDLFINNGTLIRKTNNLEEAPNIILQNLSVDIRPFWGDKENFEIGITRQDFNIKSVLIGSFVVFGTNITMPNNGVFGLSDKFGDCRGGNVCGFSTINTSNIEGNNINTFRTINPDFEIYTISNKISDEDVSINNFDINPPNILKLDESEYSIYQSNGVFAIVIPCNRKKIITNEFGEEEVVENDNPNGIFTEFNGYFLVTSDDSDITNVSDNTDRLDRKRGGPIFKRAKFKIPQKFAALSKNSSNMEFIKKNFKFSSGKFYSIAQFYNTAYRSDNDNEWLNSDITNNFKNILGLIRSSNVVVDPEDSVDENDIDPNSNNLTFPFNFSIGNDKRWGSQWLNFCMFHIQYAAIDRKKDQRVRVSGSLIADSRSSDMYYLKPNNQNLGGGRFNSDGFINAQCNYFDFIEVTKNDIILLFTLNNKKIVRQYGNNNGIILESNYIYTNHDETIFIPTNTNEIDISSERNKIKGINYIDDNQGAFIYKGLGSADCINYLFELNLI
jgi:hypothetical protein